MLAEGAVRHRWVIRGNRSTWRPRTGRNRTDCDRAGCCLRSVLLCTWQVRGAQQTRRRAAVGAGPAVCQHTGGIGWCQGRCQGAFQRWHFSMCNGICRGLALQVTSHHLGLPCSGLHCVVLHIEPAACLGSGAVPLSCWLAVLAQRRLLLAPAHQRIEIIG